MNIGNTLVEEIGYIGKHSIWTMVEDLIYPLISNELINDVEEATWNLIGDSIVEINESPWR